MEANVKVRPRTRRSKELDEKLLEKVGEVAAAVESATNAGEVVCALHSLAVMLFPVNSAIIAESVDQQFKPQVLDVQVPSKAEQEEWWNAFYFGAAFPAITRVLIYNAVPKWLSSVPLSARMQVYDTFFNQGPPSEVVEALVPCLHPNETSKDRNLDAVLSNIERLLVLCLLEKDGVRRIVKYFGVYCGSKPDPLPHMLRVAQLLASIPDKSRRESSSVLSPYIFFRKIVVQLLVEAEEMLGELPAQLDIMTWNTDDSRLFFVGEMFSRICRRGFSDILILELVPRILSHVQSSLSLNGNLTTLDIESTLGLGFWLRIISVIKDQYAIERMSEELLRNLASKDIHDSEAYWILWILFNRTFNNQTTIRSMFLDKFLFWKVFPFCCLRWILQFSVLECSLYSGTNVGIPKNNHFLDIVSRLSTIWCKREFVQSATMEQQAYITAALGWCIERMTKEDLESMKNFMSSILQGVSCRLESPLHLTRRMGSSIALAFSKVVDPKNPLYLDDELSDPIDWEFGVISQQAKAALTAHVSDNKRQMKETKRLAHEDRIGNETIGSDMHVNVEHSCEEEDDKSSDLSLQPYDLSDDDTDLQDKFAQLSDITAALRKSDDPDCVERALAVAERLVRACPDELCHNAKDLVSALIQVRTSDVVVEGEEDSAEDKRQKALVALAVTCPFESLDVLTKLLYSPSVDVGQRILIVDAMTDAAQELANTRTIIASHKQRELIASVNNPWYIPSNIGPPGAGPWKEVSHEGSSLSWSQSYERELPSKPGQVKMGKPRRWSLRRPTALQMESLTNKFPLYAAAFMLPAMQGFDKKRHGIDLLNRDFIVLGKLIYMLGVCMKCTAMHPEASALAPALLDMLRTREVANHAEAYVRRSVLFAASCILTSLHPSFVASALIEGNQEISEGVEWIRSWALHVAESDPDTECSTMAVACIQAHAEMALQTSRVLESASSFKGNVGSLHPKIDDIIMPFSNI